MTFLICKQEKVKPRRATVPMQRDNCTAIFKAVPPDICENCGEYYVSEQITQDCCAAPKRALRTGR
ncbi:MAG: type II toxin-antitoxin system MqsA family antitoxin [Phycisphaerae bacterium]